MEKYYSFSYGKRDKDAPYHYKPISLNEVDRSKPMIFVFGGSGTVGSRQINGYMKITESILGVFNDDVTIVGCEYGDANETETIDDRDMIFNCNNFVKEIFDPLIRDENGRLDIATLCKNLRKINIVAHCYGDVVEKRLLNCAMARMLELGYKEEEVMLALRQVFIVAVASDMISELGTRLCVVSPLDLTVDNNYHGREILLKDPNSVELNPNDKKQLVKFNGESLGKHIMEVSNIFNDNPRVYVVSENNSIYLAVSSPFDKFWDDHSMKYIKRENVTTPNEDATIVGDYVSRCIMSALCNSVANALINEHTQKFQPLSVEEIKQQLQEVVKPLNSKELPEEEKPWFWKTL